jgi:transcriptional regulator with PAS, ATPase and Fis domain
MTPVYVSDSMKEVISRAERVSRSDIPVLIVGESGVGKEIVARFIHDRSGRRGRFIGLNCSAIPDNLIESELFGYKRGAFTDARDDKIGFLKAADGGTLFLDEISDMSLSAQAKLLRALEFKEYYPLGSVFAEKSDFRLICATNGDLAALVKSGKFRFDLYSRISWFKIRIPPLRERVDDIAVLAEHFVRLKRPGVKISVKAMERLICYEWPGNVRELMSVIDYCLIILGDRDVIEFAHLPEDIRNDCPLRDRGISLRERMECFRRRVIDFAVKFYGGNLREVARELGVSISSLYRMVRGFERGNVGEDRA